MRPGLQRAIVAVTTMMTTFLVMLDMTIANVALDHMRGTLSAGVDEITWVLTSFLVANAISLPSPGG
jgi:DHA2 family multidrug resistance protein